MTRGLLEEIGEYRRKGDRWVVLEWHWNKERKEYDLRKQFFVDRDVAFQKLRALNVRGASIAALVRG